jgi:hypothetical protein
MQWQRLDLFAVCGVWAVAAVILAWAYLPDAWRRGLSLLASATGLAFLIVAVNTEGLREAPTVTDFLLGTPYVLSQTSASASLPYYLLTAVCLLLGLTGLAAGEPAARTLRRHYLASAVAVTLAASLLRFGFEKAAAPPDLSRLFGVIWLAPITGGFLFLNLRGEAQAWRRLTRALLAYAFAARGLVVALYVVASGLGLGTHYDIVPVTRIQPAFSSRVFEFSPGSAQQFLGLVLLPQLTLWVLYTLVAGWLGALVARGLVGLHRDGVHARRAGVRAPAAAGDAPAQDEDARLAPPGRLRA